MRKSSNLSMRWGSTKAGPSRPAALPRVPLVTSKASTVLIIASASQVSSVAFAPPVAECCGTMSLDQTLHGPPLPGSRAASFASALSDSKRMAQGGCRPTCAATCCMHSTACRAPTRGSFRPIVLSESTGRLSWGSPQETSPARSWTPRRGPGGMPAPASSQSVLSPLWLRTRKRLWNAHPFSRVAGRTRDLTVVFGCPSAPKPRDSQPCMPVFATAWTTLTLDFKIFLALWWLVRFPRRFTSLTVAASDELE
mmetsp:Transcript_35070/g.98490  ORF Transcript_35070/g.98490 Transcript_35070/m.98490 type:complete len:253 (-) Transcript_35070:349-1107(-)